MARRGRGGLLARASVSLVDQVLSSASNVLVALAVGRLSSVDSFGEFAVLMILWATGLAVTRGAFGTPLLLSPREDVRRELGRACVGAALLGALFGLAIMGTALVLHRPGLGVWLALATPIVLVQDVHRFAALALTAPKVAATWDGVWVAATVVLFLLTWTSTGWLSAEWLVGGWTLAAAVSALGLTRALRPELPTTADAGLWRASLAHRVRYGLEAAIGSLSSLVVVSSAAAVIGSAAAAALRGAGTLLGPLSIVMTAIPMLVVPHAVQAGRSPRATWRVLSRVAVVMSLVSVSVGLVGSRLPSSIGRGLLGPSWDVVAPLLPITGLEYAFLAWVSVMYTSMRARGRSTALLRARVAHAFLSVLLGLGAAWQFETAKGVAWALAATAGLAAVAIRPMLRLAGPVAAQTRLAGDTLET